MGIPIGTGYFASRVKSFDLHYQKLVIVLIPILIVSIFMMAISGINQTNSIVDSKRVSLGGILAKYEPAVVNLTLNTADQIKVDATSVESKYFSCNFVDEKNYELFANITTRLSAKIIHNEFGIGFSYQDVISNPGEYSLVFKSEDLAGTNVTYTIMVYHIDTTVLQVSFYVASSVASVLLGVFLIEEKTAKQMPEELHHLYYD